ncbi:MAG: transcription antitermination factor NusB [Deltaproteobacteria bacterium]|nr:MAG: transcription antitermination factor NusB [Pseudomonadota bacterium]PIE66321.1 MAG: transcription antitermination factor NusB [Deltaproteobacteria bacterium]
MGARREGRVAAMHVLYQLDTARDFNEVELALARYFMHQPTDEEVIEPAPLPEDVRDFASELCCGVVEHRETIDEALERASTNWRVERMSRVDRNVLRVAAYELMFCPEVPGRVAINEALELGKSYGTTDSRPFINGVLDKLRRSLPVS